MAATIVVQGERHRHVVIAHFPCGIGLVDVVTDMDDEIGLVGDEEVTVPSVASTPLR